MVNHSVSLNYMVIAVPTIILISTKTIVVASTQKYEMWFFMYEETYI